MYQEDPYASGGGLGPFFGMLLLVVGSAVAVYIDAKRIGARKGLVTGIANNSPGVWAFGVIAMWIVVLPIYLASRGKIVAAVHSQRSGGYRPQYQQPGQQQAWGYGTQTPRFVGGAVPGVGPVSPPAGWYEDPQHQGYNRWWDGRRWTEHRASKPY
jgi:hypothetical protein